MSRTCDFALNEMGGGIAAALRAVDCVAGSTTAQYFNQLFANGGSLELVLVMVLVIYVAIFGISLLLGRSNLSIRALLPRIITIGFVLTFATSWLAYQSVVWNLAIGAPDWLATVLTRSEGSATHVFAQKLDVVFMAVQQASEGQEDFAAFSPPGMMWMGATMLLLGTVGVLVTARIALALLVALGPIFVVMALFGSTRGLFTGWLKGVVMLAIAPLLAVLGGSIMLELAVPVLSALSPFPGEIDPQAAVAFFLVGAVHLALMAMVMKVASTMVAGWQVFGFASGSHANDSSQHQPSQPAGTRSIYAQSAQPGSTARRADAVSVAVRSAANDAGEAAAATHRTRLLARNSGGKEMELVHASQSRARGIGSRFRSPNTRKPEIVR